MLSQEDRRRLEDIERHLEAEDPAFVARMRGLPARRPAPVMIVVCLVLWAITPMVGTIAGWPAAGAMVVLLAATATLTWWLPRRHRHPRAT